MFLFLLVVLAYLTVAAMVAIGTVGFNPGALRPLIRGPRHALMLITSRRARRNHALEHATINVILRKQRRTLLTGMPDEEGFHLRGRVPSDVVATSAQEALRLLRDGQKHLAVHQRCPTSLTATQLLLAAIFTGLIVFIDQFGVPTFLAALLASALLGRPLSPYLQRLAFIDPDVERMSVRDVEVEEPQGRLAMLSYIVSSPVFVRTAERQGGRRWSRREDPGDGDVTLITSDKREIPAGSYRVRE